MGWGGGTPSDTRFSLAHRQTLLCILLFPPSPLSHASPRFALIVMLWLVLLSFFLSLAQSSSNLSPAIGITDWCQTSVGVTDCQWPRPGLRSGAMAGLPLPSSAAKQRVCVDVKGMLCVSPSREFHRGQLI